MARIDLNEKFDNNDGVVRLEKTGRVVGPRGWCIACCLGGLICACVMGQMTQQYAKAEAAGEGDFRLSQTESLRNRNAGDVMPTKVGSASRENHDWVMKTR